MGFNELMQYEVSLQEILNKPTESMIMFMVATYILGARIFRISDTKEEFGGSKGAYGWVFVLWTFSPVWVPIYYLWKVLAETGLRISGDPRPKAKLGKPE